MANKSTARPRSDTAKHLVEETKPGDNGISGKIQMSEDVVETIAGIAAREIRGIHSLGRSRLIPFGDKHRRGVAAEVGNTEAALDLEVVIEHGCNIREVAADLRKKVAAAVESMANRKVVEVNLDVIGVHYESEEPEPEETPRVR